MIVFAKTENGFQHSPGESFKAQEQFTTYKTEMARLEDQYTNYGCYCYIGGVDEGLFGGGKARDQVQKLRIIIFILFD